MTHIKKLRSAVALCCLFLFTMGVAHATGEYVLSTGDKLRIHVYNEPELTFEELLVGQNGRISYPFLDAISVTGKTAGQIEKEIAAGLRRGFIVNPKVSVSIAEYRPFFVNGEVNTPGAVPYQPGLTLRKAVSLAGGFTERANKKRMLVVSDDDPEQKEKKQGLDYQVRPGDIITVEDTFF